MAIVYDQELGRFIDYPDYMLHPVTNWDNGRPYTSWINNNPGGLFSGASQPSGFGATGFSTLGSRIGGGLGGGLGKFRNFIGNPNFSLKGMFGSLNNAYKGQTGTDLWTKGAGIDGIGKLANIGGAIYQGGKAIGNLNAAGNADSDYNNTIKDIKMSAAANPMAMSALDISQKKLLRQARSGTAKNDMDNIMSGVGRGLPDIAKNAVLGFATGGVPGALIQGIGTAVNKGTEGYTQGTEEAQAKLQALYDRLNAAEQEYNMMRRPQGLYGAGLQSRYFNQLW